MFLLAYIVSSERLEICKFEMLLFFICKHKDLFFANLGQPETKLVTTHGQYWHVNTSTLQDGSIGATKSQLLYFGEELQLSMLVALVKVGVAQLIG